MNDKNNPGLKEGGRIESHRILRIAELKEISSFFYELEHEPTGARHIHISNKNTENTFGIAFKTVPKDSTGVAHILEHTTLCGSRKFPVRDPFFSMLKRSLNTFMNAFTASDWTMYPFSTQNKKDFYNLMDVYLDAVFYPNLDMLSFKQEGHRLELEGEELVYRGVVYNEMKGAMSSPDQVMVRSILKALYPDTTYSNNSGGDPAVIPTLTWQQLIDFHRRHYHPSNSYFYTYGNLPLKEHIEFIEKNYLSEFEKIDPGTIVPSQPRWKKPKKAKFFYPLAPNEDPRKKCQACVGWLTSDIKDSFEVLMLSLLGEILLGNAGSPLRKALIDSGLGSALSDGTGFDPENRDTMFTCGLKDVEDTAAEKIEKIVFDLFNDLVKNGIDRELIEAAIHQLEFHRKEITNTPYPHGLKLFLSFGGAWFHEGDPLKILRLDNDLARLREEIDKGPFFENAIKKYFLENSHRVVFTLVPDQNMAAEEEERVKKELEEKKAKLTKEELDEIIKDAQALLKLQESEEDLSVLPTLELKDIPPEVQVVSETRPYAPFNAKWFDRPTSGIFYFTAVAGISDIPENLVFLVPFFCHAFTKCGTFRRNYIDMARRVDLYTGGIVASSHARTGFGEKEGRAIPFISFSGKCLERNQGKLFEIIEEFISDFAFTDLVRLKSLFLEYRAALESMIVRNGHGLAISLASRNFSSPRYLNEIWQGIHQLRFIKEITDDLTDEKLEAVADDLFTIGKNIFTGKNMRFALVGEEKALLSAVEPLGNIINSLDDKGSFQLGIPENLTHEDFIPMEGWATSTAVSFVARSFETVSMDHDDAPALAVISRILRSLYLHPEIREKGGAYGGFSIYNPEDGLFSLCSYRDPHILRTFRIYDGAEEFITSENYSDEDIKEAVLQVCSDIDKPDPPGPAAKKAFFRNLMGLTDDARNKFKSSLLAMTKKKVVETAGRYFSRNRVKKGNVVISNEDMLRAVNEKLPDNPLTIYKI